MPVEEFLTLLVLAFVSTWTPGPNNALLITSSVNFGFKATIPHMMGVAFGFPIMAFCVGSVFGHTVVQYENDYMSNALHVISIGLLLWIAWKIANSGGLTNQQGKPRPFRIYEAFLFQWINPKAWAMTFVTSTQYIQDDHPLKTALIVAGAFVVAGCTSSLGWSTAGHTLGQWLGEGNRLRIFNRIMAILIVGCIFFLVS